MRLRRTVTLLAVIERHLMSRRSITAPARETVSEPPAVSETPAGTPVLPGPGKPSAGGAWVLSPEPGAGRLDGGSVVVAFSLSMPRALRGAVDAVVLVARREPPRAARAASLSAAAGPVASVVAAPPVARRSMAMAPPTRPPTIVITATTRGMVRRRRRWGSPAGSWCVDAGWGTAPCL